MKIGIIFKPLPILRLVIGIGLSFAGILLVQKYYSISIFSVINYQPDIVYELCLNFTLRFIKFDCQTFGDIFQDQYEFLFILKFLHSLWLLSVSSKKCFTEEHRESQSYTEYFLIICYIFDTFEISRYLQMTSFLLTLFPDLTPGYFLLFLIVALLIGMSKAGLSGFGLAMVPLMALIFGAKPSTGVILPMLDCCRYYGCDILPQKCCMEIHFQDTSVGCSRCFNCACNREDGE